MAAYYNENDKFAAAWLRELIKAKLIADGEVDERSIEDVRPDDLRGFVQCHFFAGIGGWSYALRLAGWPDDRAVWTGSCPCQPFSMAGKGGGIDDSRHLWPAWFPLIRERRPRTVFGEQVASKDGEYWFDLVHADLEGIDYAIGPVDLPAAGVGAPNRRQRFWFVADAEPDGQPSQSAPRLHAQGQSGDDALRRGADDDMEHAEGERRQRGEIVRRQARRRPEHAGRMGDSEREGFQGLAGNGDDRDQPGRLGAVTPRSTTAASGAGGVGIPDGINATKEREGDAVVGEQRQAQRGREQQHAGARAAGGDGGGHRANRTLWSEYGGGAPAIGPTSGFWFPCDWLPCSDGKARPVEPGTFPLADGVPARVGRLRGYGNAIVPQVAAEVIAAYMEITDL